MKTIKYLVKLSLVILTPILVLFLYVVSGVNVKINNTETYDFNEFTCDIEEEVPENKVIIDFLEENYQDVVNQKDGNIPMEDFRKRVEYAINYRPELSEYLENKAYSYELSSQAKKKAHELTDEESYSHTVNNIHKWILDNIEYTYNREWYTAKSTWEEKSANCNGISFLTCGMMREAGIPCMVVANDKHAWTEYLYLDDQGRIIWYLWDQGLEGYPVLSENTYGYDLN
jgi:transglutaminase-like putative cysteine protease